MSIAKLALSMLLVLVAGCITAPRSVPTSPSPSPPATSDPRAPSELRPSAATALLEQARSERRAGELARAESVIERALRIEPDDPWLWIELGEIKRAAGDRSQAAAMGRKALSLAAGDRAAESSARTLLR